MNVVRFSLTLTLACCLLSTRSTQADTFVWTGLGDGVTWNSGLNWQRTSGTGTIAFPQAGDTATFNSNATVANGTAGTLIIDAGTTLSLSANTVRQINSTINNQGVLTFESDSINSIGGVIDTRYQVDGITSLRGGGVVQLNGAETGFGGTGPLVNEDNTIRGPGTIDVGILANRSILRAEAGLLNFSDTLVSNSDGQVQVASDGILVGGTIIGGTVASEVGGLVRGTVLDDLTITGELTASANNATILSRDITNQGVMTFEADATNNIGGVVDTRYQLSGNLTLDGGGVVQLNGAETGFSGLGTLTNVDNTIRGVGTIDVDINNQSVIRAENGTLTLGESGARSVVIDSTGGEVQIASDGLINAGARGEIRGGTLASEVGGRIQNGTLADLTITGELTKTANNATNLEGTITNQGVMTFEADNINTIGNFVDTRFQVDSIVDLDGGGVVQLNGIETGFGGSGSLVNADNTIRGAGTIDVNLLNRGAILAEGGTLALTASSDGASVLNQSLMVARSGSDLSLGPGTTVNNNEGEIQLEAGGVLLMSGSSEVFGGTISSDPGGRVAGGTLADVRITGELTQTFNSGTTLRGTITNQGVIAFEPDATNNLGGFIDTRLQIDSSVSLNGGGEVRLNGIETGFGGNGVLTNVDNTIRGPGTIDIDMNNQSILRAENGDLTLGESGTGSVVINNSGGQVQIASDGRLDGGTGGQIRGGTLASEVGGRVRSGTLADLTLTGELTKTANNATTLEGTITNQGVMTFEADNINTIGGVVDTQFQVNSNVTLDGGGTIQFAGVETGFDGSGVLTNLDNLITGNGTIDTDLINFGTLSPGNGAGRIDINGSVLLGDTSVLDIELAGLTQATEYDLLTIGGGIELGGDLQVSFAGGFESFVTEVDTFEILQAGSLVGEFANVQNGGFLTTTDGLSRFQVNFGAGSAFNNNSVVLSNITAVPEPSVMAVLSVACSVFWWKRRRKIQPEGSSNV